MSQTFIQGWQRYILSRPLAYLCGEDTRLDFLAYCAFAKLISEEKEARWLLKPQLWKQPNRDRRWSWSIISTRKIAFESRPWSELLWQSGLRTVDWVLYPVLTLLDRV